MTDYRRVLAVYSKDFRDSLRYPIFVLMIMLPIALSLLFTFLLGSPPATTCHLAVYQEAPTPFMDELRMSQVLVLEETGSWDEARRLVADGKVDAAMLLPGSLDEEVEAGERVEIQYLYDKSSTNQANAGLTSVNSILERYAGVPQVALFRPRAVREFKQGQLMIPAWVTFAVALIGITLMAGNLAEEKENGTLSAMLVTPVSRFELMLAKTLFGVTLVLATVILIVVLSGIITVKLVLLVFLALLGSVSMVAVGLLVGVLSRDQRQAGTIGTVVYLPVIIPVFVLGLNSVVDAVAHVLPTYYLWHGTKVLLLQENISSVWVDFLVLACYGAVLLAVTAYALRRR